MDKSTVVFKIYNKFVLTNVLLAASNFHKCIHLELANIYAYS